MKPARGGEGHALAGAQLVAAFIESLLDAVWLVDAETLRIVACNGAASELLGIAAKSLWGREIADLCPAPEDLLFWREAASGLTQGIDSDTWIQHADGRALPVSRRVSRLALRDGEDLFVVVVRDRSEQRRIEQALEDRAAELAATLESTADGLLVTDLRGNIRRFNRAFADLWSVPAALLRGRDDDALLAHMRQAVVDPAGYMRRLAALEDVALREAIDTVTLRGGRVLQRVSFPQVSCGETIGRVYSFRDVSARLEASRRLDLLSHSDALTGLPTRSAFADRVEFSLALAQRDGKPFALLLANLDRFKTINDTLGHGFGDRVLAEAAGRVKASLRQVDSVARLGGDEFVMLAHEADRSGAETAARRVLESLRQPFSEGGIDFSLGCSIGIALYPEHGQSLDELLRHAQAAMREVKAGGRAAYRVHRMNDVRAGDPRSTLKLDTAMRQALQAGHFHVHYQPQVDLGSGRVLGAEALLRWRDPELGNVSPAEFIPLAEQSGFIVVLGDWVLRQAVAQAARWHAQGRALVVSVNVSAVQFHRDGFVARVADTLAEARLPPALLELELTESILIRDAQQALVRLQALSALGVKLAIDDFGTGYSSLGYLKRFPLDRLKIDRSFVRGLPNDASDAGIVSAIVNLGRALHLAIVAEGVETEAQRQFLMQSGCAQYQGFLFAPALDSESFEARLAAAPPGSETAGA